MFVITFPILALISDVAIGGEQAFSFAISGAAGLGASDGPRGAARRQAMLMWKDDDASSAWGWEFDVVDDGECVGSLLWTGVWGSDDLADVYRGGWPNR
jgi:hypothetical protein